MHGSMDELHALALLVAANATPVVVAKLVGDLATFPLDFGHVMPDGERLFGSHKTWRGLLSGVLGCALVATILGLPLWIGAAFGFMSLFADAWSSCAKRRMHLKPGTEVFALDQLGEALLPLLVFAGPLSLDLWEVVLIILAFVLLDKLTAPLRRRQWL